MQLFEGQAKSTIKQNWKSFPLMLCLLLFIGICILRAHISNAKKLFVNSRFLKDGLCLKMILIFKDIDIYLV
jgi:hypothetical protein